MFTWKKKSSHFSEIPTPLGWYLTWVGWIHSHISDLFLRSEIHHSGGIPLRWDASTHMNSFLYYYMSTKQRRILLKTFIESQFAYCPLVLMFHSRILNSKINHLHERTLRIETMTVHAKIYLKWPISAEKHTIFSHLIVKGQIEQLNTHDEQYIPDER